MIPFLARHLHQESSVLDLTPVFIMEKTMLVLTRKVGEKIIIDECIEVTITQVEGDKVRIGVTAPPKVRVDREEIHRRVPNSQIGNWSPAFESAGGGDVQNRSVIPRLDRSCPVASQGVEFQSLR